MNENTKRKVVIIGILLIFIGRLYLKLPSACSLNCKSILTELDLITCLDACAINAHVKVPFSKIFKLVFIVITGVILLSHFLEQIFIKKTPSYIHMYNKVKSLFNIGNKYLNEYNYIKLEED